MSFLDAYSGYHQTPLYAPDQDKTAFITTVGLYCYKVMPFGLKNAGATYQRLVTKIFKDQMGDTMEVYIIDMLVKSRNKEDHLLDLSRTFEILRKYRMKLNASKCSFGVQSGKFLGYLVSKRGIEANPDQIDAINRVQPPRTIRDVQKLTGMLAALNRFISKSSEKCKAFFQLLKGNKTVEWNQDCSQALDELKAYLSSPLLLVIPQEDDPLYLYLAVSRHTVSAALVCEKAGIQHPIYNASRGGNSCASCRVMSGSC